MKSFGLVPLVLAGMLLSNLGYSQQTQPAQPQPAQPAQRSQEHAANLDVGNTPTRSDMYCSGFLTTEKVSDKMFVAAGHNSPDQTRYAGASDVIFIHGQGMKEGERYQIVRHVKDTNHYEMFPGQKAAVRNLGVPYLELAIVKVTDVQKNTAVATFELSCSDVMPGDIVIPLVEREAPPFRKVSLDRYTPPTGKPQGRIVMAKEFDSFLGSKYKAYLNIGADKGLKPGDYLRATRTYSYSYRDPVSGLSLKASEYDDTQMNPQKLPRGDVSSLPRRTLGDMIVLQVHPKSSTAMVLTALEDIAVGDGVEVMDTSDAPVLPPISPSFTNAPQPNAASASTVPPTINCSASPTSLRAGESASISCQAASPDNRPINITYVANGGKLSSNRNQATLDTTDTGPGPIAVRATAFDDRQLSASTVVTVNVEARSTCHAHSTEADGAGLQTEQRLRGQPFQGCPGRCRFKIAAGPQPDRRAVGFGRRRRATQPGIAARSERYGLSDQVQRNRSAAHSGEGGNRFRTQSGSMDAACRHGIARSAASATATRRCSAGPASTDAAG